MTTHNVSRMGTRQYQLHRTMLYASRMTPNERLREARKRAGFDTAADAARRFGWPVPTYRSHENGTRGFPATRAPIYAKALNVREEWLLYGKGEIAPHGNTISRPEDAARLLAIYHDLPDAESRADMIHLSEMILIAAKARRRPPEGDQGPDDQAGQ